LARAVFGKGEIILPFNLDQTDLLAGTTQWLSAPHAAVIKQIEVVVQLAVTTGGVIKAKLGSTDVVGATVTVADGAAAGTVYNASTALEEATAIVAKDGAIQIIVDAAFATAGRVHGWVRLVGKL
jgi:hypothetical protein